LQLDLERKSHIWGEGHLAKRPQLNHISVQFGLLAGSIWT
jgi:hypothetical protein